MAEFMQELMLGSTQTKLLCLLKNTNNQKPKHLPFKTSLQKRALTSEITSEIMWFLSTIH